VTGAATGLGAAITEVMLGEGARVVATDIRDEDGTQLAKRLGDAVSYAHLDVTSESEWNSLVRGVTDELGPIDILVNNVGGSPFQALVKTSLADYDRLIAMNQTSVFLGMRAVLPGMLQASQGAIVNVSSIDGIRGAPGLAVYCAAKHAVLGLTRAVALETAARGVRVNAVCPGVMQTPAVDEATRATGGTADFGAKLAAGVPIGRVADPMEVARVIAFLASDDASYCTGSEFVVDGAWTTGFRVG
jgi:3alpha(or 20beta)-hydroxysteroid dehydrogenase